MAIHAIASQSIELVISRLVHVITSPAEMTSCNIIIWSNDVFVTDMN